MIFHQISRSMAGSVLFAALFWFVAGVANGADDNQTERGKADLNKRLLLLWQGPDGHQPTTHEFEAGIRLIANWFQQNTPFQVMISEADETWDEGAELLERADSTVLFISQGSRWIRERPERLKAFQDYAKRGGGLVGLHWAIGSKRDEDIADFLALLGATHGGSDRSYRYLTTRLRPALNKHPIHHGVRAIDVEDEFYFKLKTVKSPAPVVPVMESRIDNDWHMVAWAWERPDGGRSFGFSGLHNHKNWGEENYRRLVFQGIFWTLKEPIPSDGIVVNIREGWLKLPARGTDPN